MSDFILINVNKKRSGDGPRMKFTPTPKVRTLITGMNNGQEHISETINYILQDYYNKMPVQERQRIIAKSKHHY